MAPTVGRAFTVTAGLVTETVLVQPGGEYVTVREYTPLCAVVLAVKPVLSAKVVVLKLFGPDQLYDVSMPGPETVPAVNVIGDPIHKLVTDGLIPATVGRAFTVTAVGVTTPLLVQPVPG
jgi:hypothetical protein